MEFIGGPRDGGMFPVVVCREYVRVTSFSEHSTFAPPLGKPDMGGDLFPHLYCLCRNSITGAYAYIYDQQEPDEEEWIP